MGILATILGAGGSAIIGGLMNMVPLIFQYFKRKQEFNQNLELMKLQHEMRLAEADKGIKLAEVSADVQDIISAREADKVYFGISPENLEKIQILKAKIRPYTALGTFSLFAIGTLLSIVNAELGSRVLTPSFMSFFGLITGYYFSSRMVSHTK